MERTVVNILSDFPKINVNDKLLFLGSCFSDNIGEYFQKFKLNATVNPFGVIFHPFPIVNLMERALNKNFFKASDFFEFQDYWFCYELPGACAKFELGEALDFANVLLERLNDELTTIDRLILTFGSAVERSFEGFVVANCHKQPINQFERDITNHISITDKLSELFKHLIKLNPKLKIQLTVSPVRHIKEGVRDNLVSKSSLVLSCSELCEKHDFVECLPIYELVIDELRDYSFFKDDLVHPNQKAIDIIWERLYDSIFSNELKTYIDLSQKLLNSLEHKSLYPKSQSNLTFLTSLRTQLETHNSLYSLDWSTEIEAVKNRFEKMA